MMLLVAARAAGVAPKAVLAPFAVVLLYFAGTVALLQVDDP